MPVNNDFTKCDEIASRLEESRIQALVMYYAEQLGIQVGKSINELMRHSFKQNSVKRN